MIAARDILRITDEIAARFRPQQVIVFGSYAYGTPTGDSDVDLMVIASDGTKTRKLAARIYCDIHIGFPVDILARRRGELRRRLALNDFFMMDVVEKGLVVYDAGDEGMGRKGRRRLRNRIARLSKEEVAEV